MQADERPRAPQRARLGERPLRGDAAQAEPGVAQAEAGPDLGTGDDRAAARAHDACPHDAGRHPALQHLDRPEASLHPAAELRPQ